MRRSPRPRGVLLPHPADGRRRDPEHLAAVWGELGPEPEGPSARFPGGGARRQGPGTAGPVLARPRDDDRQLIVGHVPATFLLRAANRWRSAHYPQPPHRRAARCEVGRTAPRSAFSHRRLEGNWLESPAVSG